MTHMTGSGYVLQAVRAICGLKSDRYRSPDFCEHPQLSSGGSFILGGASALGFERKFHIEPSAAEIRVPDPHAAVVGPEDLGHDREPESQATVVAVA